MTASASKDTPSAPSLSSLTHSSSVRSSPPQGTTSYVVTTPPWARDEPPSPKDSSIDENHLTVQQSRPSDVASYHSTYAPSTGPSRWWAFTLPRPREPGDSPAVSTPKPDRKSVAFKERSISWLPTTSALREGGGSFSRRDKQAQSSRQDWNLSITLPTPTAQPFTLSHNATPGWETPWTSRVGAQGPRHSRRQESSTDLEELTSQEREENEKRPKTRKQRLRTFLLVNTYVPLFFRVLNLTFTSAALGVAIRIRQWEKANHAMGAVGSSPTLVIIFAPLTLVHVMSAIYLEYFGRPLGLWRTSAKLAYTLSETVFICVWSAALSLCFDNFFTSLVPCASPSHISWYNDLPRPQSTVPNFEGSFGDSVCDAQLALICVVGIGLLFYCTNLVISLFRIFEKVKYQSPAAFKVS